MTMYNAKGSLFSVFRFLFVLKYVMVVFIGFQIQACKSEDNNDQYFMPAEFEPQEAVWMGCQGIPKFKNVRSDIVRALLPYVQIKIVSNTDSVLQICKDYLEHDHIKTYLLGFTTIKDNEFWMRDHGATFVINKNGQMKAIDFEWADYGYEDWLKEYYAELGPHVRIPTKDFPDNQKHLVDSLMGVMLGIPVVKSWIRMEGGMIEVNGNGTIILNESLTLSRNNGASKDSIYNELKRVLGICNIIWLKNGLVEDPHICETIIDNYIGMGTGGHTDEFVRFANAKTILLAWVPEEEKDLNPINQLNYQRMSVNYQILINSKDIDGKNFTIIKVPLPNPIIKKIKVLKGNAWDGSLNIPEFMFKPNDGWKSGDSVNRIASASYLNYFITNGIVLIPTYVEAGSSVEKEEKVLSIFKKAFPDRKIVSINALPLNWRGGGMHCMATQQPRRHITP